MIKLARGGSRAAERAAERAVKQAVRGIRMGARKLKQAERKGSLATWKNRIGIGVQLVEVAMLATAAAKGLKIGKAARRAPVQRARSVKKRAARA